MSAVGAVVDTWSSRIVYLALFRGSRSCLCAHIHVCMDMRVQVNVCDLRMVAPLFFSFPLWFISYCFTSACFFLCVCVLVYVREYEWAGQLLVFASHHLLPLMTVHECMCFLCRSLCAHMCLHVYVCVCAHIASFFISSSLACLLTACTLSVCCADICCVWAWVAFVYFFRVVVSSFFVVSRPELPLSPSPFPPTFYVSSPDGGGMHSGSPPVSLSLSLSLSLLLASPSIHFFLLAVATIIPFLHGNGVGRGGTLTRPSVQGAFLRLPPSPHSHVRAHTPTHTFALPRRLREAHTRRACVRVSPDTCSDHRGDGHECCRGNALGWVGMRWRSEAEGGQGPGST